MKGTTMKMVTGLVAGCLAMTAWGDGVEFTSPKAGACYTLGDVVPIEFTITDQNATWYPSIFQVIAGPNIVTLNVTINGEDSVSLTGRYNWVIDSRFLTDPFTRNEIDLVNDEVQINFVPYPGSGGTVSGASAVFRIDSVACSGSSVRKTKDFRSASGVTIRTNSQQVVLSSARGALVSIHSPNGRLVRTVKLGIGEADSVRLPAQGIFLVRDGRQLIAVRN